MIHQVINVLLHANKFCRYSLIWPTFQQEMKPEDREVKHRHFTILVLPKAGCDCLVPPTLSVTARTLPLLSPMPPSTGSTMATKIQFFRVAIKVAWEKHLLKDWIAYSSCAVYSLWPTKHLLSKNLKICVATKSVEHLCQPTSEHLLQKTLRTSLSLCAAVLDMQWSMSPDGVKYLEPETDASNKEENDLLI